LQATQAGPAASMSAAQCIRTAAAARSAAPPLAGTDRVASGHSRAGSGSNPSTIWLSRSATRAARRSPKLIGATLAPRPATAGTIVNDVGVSLGRIAWIATVATCVVAAILLFVSDYTGYGLLALAVGASAAINLR
jgi:hypothetical protein